MKSSKLAWLGLFAIAAGAVGMSSACGTADENNTSGGSNAVCGNGRLEAGEDCDDGNLDDGDECLSTCTFAVCGDGILSYGEECDPAIHDYCSDDCKAGMGSSASAGNGTSTNCGNGIIDEGEDCDPGVGVSTPSCDEDCTDVECGDGIQNTAAGECCEPNENEDCVVDGVVDCSKGCAVSTGGGEVSCDDHTYLAGAVFDPNNVFATTGPGVPAVWGYGGQLGLAAGNDMCKDLGADHVCTYKELEAANANGEFATVVNGGPLPVGTDFWVHRVTESVTLDDGMMGTYVSPPGAGGRCNDWTYPTGHIADGEGGTISSYPSGGNVAEITYTFDGDTVYTGSTAQPHADGNHLGGHNGTPCAGHERVILCCTPVCE